MVKRALPLLLALVLAGCPGELGNGLADAATGLIAPSGLAAVLNGGSKIALTWADRATVETGYRVEMNLSPFGTPTIGGVQFLPADATSTVYPSTPNTTYYFRVVAITGTMESDPSNVVVVTTPDVPVQPVIAARPSTPSSIGVSWSDLSNETGYVVERSSDAGATWSVAATLPAGAISWFDSGLAADTEYGYRLIAMNGFGGSTPSEPDFAQTATSAVLFYGAPFGGDYGEYTSFVVDAAGAEHIAHYDVANHRVLYSTRLGLSNYVTVTADAGPTGTQYVGGDGTSIAVDASGHVHIVAHDLTNDRLRYATNASGAWVASSIDMAPSGAKPRIACDPGTGTLHAVYQGMVPTQLKHASKAPGQPWDTTESVD
ncbi:MAG: fibronectin type III domain-containing protein, partial [Planctomycetes bacterium]|nr:fibronectin type III domain-containing protein [Planctomycetota bacterium]